VNELEASIKLQELIRELLCILDNDPNREGLRDTPMRVVKAWKHWTEGYDIDPDSLFKTFSDGGEEYDEMVIVKNVPFYSHCEHHMAPFFGTATVAYVPNIRIVGLSKLSRVIDAFARRLQVQERMTVQIANCVEKNLQPLGVGVFVKARHLCMESRGVCQQGHHTETTALRGVFRNDPAARAEFLSRLNHT
jgi:GTP cyclohydrolase I